jgi:hypothetical protein
MTDYKQRLDALQAEATERGDLSYTRRLEQLIAQYSLNAVPNGPTVMALATMRANTGLNEIFDGVLTEKGITLPKGVQTFKV